MNANTRREEAEEAIESINKRTGRNMPQALATGAILAVMILAPLIINVDLVGGGVVVFMMLALWELRVDYATVGIRIPVVSLWVTSLVALVATYLAPHHIEAMAITIAVALVCVAVFASCKWNLTNGRIAMAVASKLSNADAQMRSESSFNTGVDAHEVPRITNVAISLFTVLYIPFLACFVVLPLTWDHPVGHAFLTVFVPSLGDIGGLVFGAWLGRHKLSPRISPKKSVEGLCGSMLFCTIGVLAIFLFSYDLPVIIAHWWVIPLMGIAVGIIGTFGDLCASMIKRDLGIKDMGHLLKGHGGVMDRVDSILLAAPVICLMLFFTGL